MKQIGARQESAKVGGIGSCGRELCCSSWLNDFKSVTTTIARYQNLSINQTKLSGQCGRLKCCLNYELDTYLDALQNFPAQADVLDTEKGNAILVKKDIFKNLMWYVLPDSSRQYPLTVETVQKIKALNAKGVKAKELETAEITNAQKAKETELQFVDVVGQISLRSLERNSQKRNQRERSSGPQRDANREPNRDQNRERDPNRNPNRNPNRGPVRGPNRGPGPGKPQPPRDQNRGERGPKPQ
jgi:hypothetical protein